MLKAPAKKLLSSLGLSVSRPDPLAEQIPVDYVNSPFLPRLYRQSLGRLIYFQRMFERVKDVPGDIVECGVSVGHGILAFALLCELSGSNRKIWAFDSFEGFPPPTNQDRKTDRSFQKQETEYASPREMVFKVLKDGRVSPEFCAELGLASARFL